MNIPYGRQDIDEDDIQAVNEVLRSDYLTTGPKIEEFERVFAKYIGVKYAVAIANGTAALHAACYAAGIKQGDEVITTPITFAASANCVLYCGGKPVFADIDAATYNIDPIDIEKKLTNKTKAIIAVDFTGQPCDMDKVYAIAKKHNLVVIEDAAHSLGAQYNGRKVGAIADMTTFSFHPVKHITTGEGGMITTNDETLYKKLISFRTHGITRDISTMMHNEGPWYYEQVGLGYNYRITDIQCALGISQMNKLGGFLERRKEIAEKYNKAFKNLENITLPYQAEGCNNSWHLYVIQINHKDRKDVFDKLRQAGIGVNVHYIPVYKHPYYQQNGYEQVYCANAENLYERIISLPIFPKMTDQELDYIIKTLESILSQ